MPIKNIFKVSENSKLWKVPFFSWICLESSGVSALPKVSNYDHLRSNNDNDNAGATILVVINIMVCPGMSCAEQALEQPSMFLAASRG